MRSLTCVGRLVLLCGVGALLSYPPGTALAQENLDEVEARVTRKTSHTFYSGEDSANLYLWQPQTLCYSDSASNHEVWVMTSTDDVSSYSGAEYGHGPWSADGKRLALAINRDTLAFTRGAFYANEVWFTARSDGSSLRPRVNAPARTRVHSAYTAWSPTIPDVYYEFGRSYADETGMDRNMLYKVVVSDTEVLIQPWLDFVPNDESAERDLPKDAITSDGLYVMATLYAENTSVSIGTLEPTPDLPPALRDYAMDRGLDVYWFDTPGATSDWHDEMFVGANGDYWIYFLFTSGSWWRMRPWGTDGGPPDHTVDHTPPYDWWEGSDAQREIQPVNGLAGNMPFAVEYWSHGVPDRWGTHFAYSDVDTGVRPAVWDVENVQRVAYGDNATGAQYHSWNGWTDYTTGTDGSSNVYYRKYDDGADFSHVASIHATTGGQFTKPGQSPDGTKTMFRSDFLCPTNTNGDVFFVVTEYPHPPQIVSAAATSGTVAIRFDWRLNQGSRGYTQRGWPDPGTDAPPPPRETAAFRLWRSPDSSDWTPVSTIPADIFAKYDFATGTFHAGQNEYWELHDTVGDGTYYYAVTSIEHSGLESRALSNVHLITLSGGAGTSVEHAPYPVGPGENGGFYLTLPAAPTGVSYTHQQPPATASGQYTVAWEEPLDRALVRYYNIYAEDDADPAVDRRDRIASIPKSHCQSGVCAWVDWLGDLGGTTRYTVTSVDTQGNESVRGSTEPGPCSGVTDCVGGDQCCPAGCTNVTDSDCPSGEDGGVVTDGGTGLDAGPGSDAGAPSAEPGGCGCGSSSQGNHPLGLPLWGLMILLLLAARRLTGRTGVKRNADG